MLRRTKGFTLVEVLIAVSLFLVLLLAVYHVFIGGSKTASKGQWINGTVEEMRNALTFISREIRSATYPTTMLKDSIYDPCDNHDKSVAAKYYLRILKNSESISVPDSGKLEVMNWYVCTTEKPGICLGKLINYKLLLEFKSKINTFNSGKLILKKESFEYNTDSNNNYAKSGKLNLSPITSETGTKVLVNDVQSIEFSVSGNIPPQKPMDFFPISVKIRTMYSKDTKVSKENSIMATPQVAIDLM